MKALQWINSLLLLSGYIGFLATWILDIVYLLTSKSGVHLANKITQQVLRVVFPHFNLARCPPMLDPTSHSIRYSLGSAATAAVQIGSCL